MIRRCGGYLFLFSVYLHQILIHVYVIQDVQFLQAHHTDKPSQKSSEGRWFLVGKDVGWIHGKSPKNRMSLENQQAHGMLNANGNAILIGENFDILRRCPKEYIFCWEMSDLFLWCFGQVNSKKSTNFNPKPPVNIFQYSQSFPMFRNICTDASI